MRFDCRHRPGPLRTGLLLLAACVLLAVILSPGPAAAQTAAPAAHGDAVSGERAVEGQGSEKAHPEGWLRLVARLINFAALIGVLAYFLKTPIAGYLSARGSEIRQDLVAAAEMRGEATAQLAEIERKLQALPGELDALKKRGAEDVRAEQGRISQALAAERARLLDQTRKEIEMHLRIARRELIEYAAQLAVTVAEERVKRAITPEDHLRLMDRYTTQVEDAR